jgi:hypothetical protein
MRRSAFVTTMTVLGAIFFLVPGVWAFFWPRSFYDTIATYPPYNHHLFHDVGAFQIGVGVALLAALVWTDGLLVALAGGSAALLVHTASHFVDHDLGGRESDPWLLGVLTLLVLGALVVRVRSH